MKDRILLIGASGYLGSHLLDILVQKYDVTSFIGRVENINDVEKYTSYDFNYIFHFGSPNNMNGAIENIIQGTNNIVALANQQKAKLVYASTKGIREEHLNKYEQAKKTATMIVKHSCQSFVILIIPRVYSRDRSDGLIGAIKNGSVLDNKVLTYLTLKEFLKQTTLATGLKNRCYNYIKLKRHHIQEIKEWIL